MAYMEIRMAYNDVRYGRKKLEEVLALYREVPDKKAVFARGETLLHLAAENLDLAAVNYLLGEGCDPNGENERGHTPLWSVATRRELTPDLPERAVYDVVTALLEAGASPMKRDEEGNWCYLAAAQNGNGEFIAALHAKGARITRADSRGNNGLHLLIDSLYAPISDSDRYEKKLRESQEQGAGEAALENDRRLAREYGAKKEYRLALAFQGAKALWEAGVDPEDKNNMGETAHVLAQRRGAKKIGALLKGELPEEEGDAGEDAALREQAGGMTLHQAVGRQDEEAIRALVQLGADLNGFDDIYGCGQGTPLAMALQSCHLPTVRLLLELGADPNARGGNGSTSIPWLRTPTNGNVHKIFEEKWPAKIIDALVGAGLELDDTVDDDSNTLLTWALGENHHLEVFLNRETLRWYVVQAALGHGADVNKSNLYGQTPLMLASGGNPGHGMRMADQLQVLLLEKGAQVDARDKQGNTPLIYAAQNGGQAAREMAENLFDYGDPLAAQVNNAGKSALDYAVANNNEMLVKLLLANL